MGHLHLAGFFLATGFFLVAFLAFLGAGSSKSLSLSSDSLSCSVVEEGVASGAKWCRFGAKKGQMTKDKEHGKNNRLGGGVSLFDVAQVCSRNERETNGSRRSPTQRVALGN